MNLIPFFIDLTFEGEECRCPTCPVKTIHLGYKGPSGLVKYDYDAAEEGCAEAYRHGPNREARHGHHDAR